MQFGKVDMPEAIMDALDSDNLVIFVGAGVSKGRPTSIPTYDGLAEYVGQKAFEDYVGQPDEFLGRLETKGVEVRRIVHDRIAGSRRNKVHLDLVRLFPNSHDIRMVTTNFDACLTDALYDAGRRCEVYQFPALPYGNRFSGIVYLHGCVDGALADLVLTDEDFGRAYLAEGRVTRFLVDMFKSYVTLFIGYSHNDAVMDYLAKGMGSDLGRRRFILIKEGSDEARQWTRLGITPVHYPEPESADDDRHAELARALQKWAEMSPKNLFAHHQSISDLAGTASDLEVEDESYLIRCVHDATRLPLFTSCARDPYWLTWADEHTDFRTLFDPNTELNTAQQVLADWFVDHFAFDHAEQAFLMASKYGHKFSPYLWRSLVFETKNRKVSHTDTAVRWLKALIADPHDEGGLLQLVLSGLSPDDDSRFKILLFDHLSCPQIRITRNIFSEKTGSPDLTLDEIQLKADTDALQDTWTRVFSPSLQGLASQVATIVAHHLALAESLLEKVNDEGVHYDPSSREVPDIDSSEGDLGFLVRVGHEVLEWLSDVAPDEAEAVLDAWWHSESRLLRRLSLSIMIQVQNLSATEQVERTLDLGAVEHFGLEDDLARKLEVAYPAADERVRDQVLLRVEEHTSAVESDPHTGVLLSATLELVQRLHSAAPQHEPTRLCLEELTRRVSDEETTDQVMQPRPSKVTLPVAPSMFLSIDPRCDLDRVVSLSRLKMPTMKDAFKRAISQDVQWSMALLDSLLDNQHEAPTLWDWLLDGYRTSDLAADDWIQLVERLQRHNLAKESLSPIVEILREAYARVKASGPCTIYRLRGVILHILEEATEVDFSVSTERRRDWYETAFAHPIGTLVRLWLTSVYDDADDRGAILDHSAPFLGEVLEHPSYAGQMARIIFASEIPELYAIHPTWTRANLFPLLNWDRNRLTAEQCWHGFLWRGEWREEYLAELLPLYEQSFGALSQATPTVRNRLQDHVVRTLLLGRDDSVAQRWIVSYLRCLGQDETQRFVSALGNGLSNWTGIDLEHVWRARLQPLMMHRTLGVPSRVSSPEIVRWAEVACESDLFPQMVKMIIGMPSPELTTRLRISVFHLLEERGLPTRFPDVTAQLLRHLTAGPGMLPNYCFDPLARILEQLVHEEVSRVELTTIAEQAVVLGCPVDTVRAVLE